MKEKFKFIPFIFLFIFILVFNLFFIPNNLDEIWNYGFSYAIRLGEIPYKDFNMVITPLYSFVMTLPLLICNNYLSFVVFHSLIACIEFYLLYKMYDKKVYFVILISFIFFPLIYPTYNFFILFLTVLIVYLEGKDFKYKDYLLGFLIACCILTKQSVGVFYIVPSLIFRKKNNLSITKRFIGLIIPGIVFLIYLLVTGSLFKFFDLCFLGLFDFTGNNNGVNLSIIKFLIMIIISIFLIIKNKNCISNYYYLLSFLLFFPLLDGLHFFYVIFSFSLILIGCINKIKIKYEILFFTCLIVIICVFGKNMDVINYSRNNLKHFEYKNIQKGYVLYTDKIVRYIKDNDTIIYNDDAYFYRICANQKLGYLDLLNHGNHGYNSSDKIINLIKENKDKKYLINKDLKRRIDNKETQMDYNGYKYIVRNAKKIGEIYDYEIFSFE